jgi:cytochrome c oxidase assembly protein subunit 15
VKILLTSAQIALILVYLVIFAGAFVRLTGSGMGCPDWPKCWVYIHQQSNELLFAAGKEYDKAK